MNLHEYQGKQLFAQYGLPVSKGVSAKTALEAMEAVDILDGDMWVAKTQVHAGGRGKAGGVKLVKSKQEISDFVDLWLGKRMVTYQTDAKGQPVSRILIEECVDIQDELYLGAVIDRSTRRVVFMASTEGGVEIEKVAHETPEERALVRPMNCSPVTGRESQLPFAFVNKMVHRSTRDLTSRVDDALAGDLELQLRSRIATDFELQPISNRFRIATDFEVQRKELQQKMSVATPNRLQFEITFAAIH